MKTANTLKSIAITTALGVFFAGCGGGPEGDSRTLTPPANSGSGSTTSPIVNPITSGGSGTIGGTATSGVTADNALNAKLDAIHSQAAGANKNAKSAKSKANWAMILGGVVAGIGAIAMAKNTVDNYKALEGEKNRLGKSLLNGVTFTRTPVLKKAMTEAVENGVVGVNENISNHDAREQAFHKVSLEQGKAIKDGTDANAGLAFINGEQIKDVHTAVKEGNDRQMQQAKVINNKLTEQAAAVNSIQFEIKQKLVTSMKAEQDAKTELAKAQLDVQSLKSKMGDLEGAKAGLMSSLDNAQKVYNELQSSKDEQSVRYANSLKDLIDQTNKSLMSFNQTISKISTATKPAEIVTPAVPAQPAAPTVVPNADAQKILENVSPGKGNAALQIPGTSIGSSLRNRGLQSPALVEEGKEVITLAPQTSFGPANVAAK